MTPITAPKYCLETSGCSTQRQWRRLKREHLRQLRQAFEQFRLGCAYTPGYDNHTKKIGQHLKMLERLMSPKEWGL